LDARSFKRVYRHIRRGRSKKLREAAIYWVTGGKIVEDKTQEDAAAFGIQIEKPKPQEPDHFEVWEENWPAVEMFLRMQTQWSVSMGGLIGFKYEVLLCSGGLFDLYNVEDRKDVLERLQVMEATALTELRKRSDGSG
jgi:hypothetical protein